jgi:hypothetical protein
MDRKTHIATWVYYTYRDHKRLPQWLQNDLDYAKHVLGISDDKEGKDRLQVQRG